MKTYDPRKIDYPCFIQPKLEGISATIAPDGWVRSRTGKYFPAIQHLFKGLRPTHTLCGELYVHGWALQDIMSAVTPDVPNALSDKIQFWCYDIDINEPQWNRFNILFNKLGDDVNEHRCIYFNHTIRADRSSEADIAFEFFIKMNYEGIIYRSYQSFPGEGIYKRKPYYDAEYLCIDVIEGEGKRKGHVGKFVLKDPVTGVVFNCGGGQLSYKDLAQYLIDPPLNQLITIRYHRKSKDGIPQAAQFIRVRNNLDI